MEGYKKLQAEKQGVDEKVKTLEEQQAKASGLSSEELERANKELKEQGEKHAGERDDLVAQLSAAKKAGEAGEEDKKALLEEIENAKMAAAEAKESQTELQRELGAAKKQAAGVESLRAELEAARNSSTRATEAAEKQQAEIEELRKALRDARESQPKTVEKAETPRENGVAEVADLEVPKVNGHVEGNNGTSNGTGLENGHAQEVKVNGEIA